MAWSPLYVTIKLYPKNSAANPRSFSEICSQNLISCFTWNINLIYPTFRFTIVSKLLVKKEYLLVVGFTALYESVKSKSSLTLFQKGSSCL